MKIYQSAFGGFYFNNAAEDCQDVNPQWLFKKDYFDMSVNLVLIANLSGMSKDMNKVLDVAEQGWLDHYNELDRSNSEVWDRLLLSTKKKHQIEIVGELKFVGDELFSFLMYAFEKYDFLYSRKYLRFPPKGFEGKKMPDLIHELKRNDTYEVVGDTDVTPNQFKLLFENDNHRSVHVLRNKGKWFCFFSSHNSIRGEEKPHIGEPHMHFISSAFGYRLELVLAELSKERYRLPQCPHVDCDYSMFIRGGTHERLSHITRIRSFN
mgnify:CR=1 FL=1